MTIGFCSWIILSAGSVNQDRALGVWSYGFNCKGLLTKPDQCRSRV